MTHEQALAQAVQANANIQLQTDDPPSSPALSFTSDHPQIPISAPDSSTLAQTETSCLTTMEHRSQQPLNVDKPAVDGYNWRKYGKKPLRDSLNARNYYKCTNQGCPVRKKVERSPDGQVTRIIYEGLHNHEPPQNTYRENRDSSANPTGSSIHNNRGGSSELEASQFQTSSSNKMQHEAASLLTTTEHMTEASDCEEVGNEETGVREKDEDEPDPKRRNTGVRVSEPAASHTTVTVPVVSVRTTSDVDNLDDGYRWRKYGKKYIKGNPYPRSFYKCYTHGCGVKKYVDRTITDPKVVVTTYKGKHNHDLSAAKSSRQDGLSDINEALVFDSFGKGPLGKLKREAYENTNIFGAENIADSVSFLTRPSKNLQDPESSIGFPGSPTTSSDGALSITTDDFDVVIKHERGDISNGDFISHLRAALCRRGISVDEDCDEDAVPECRVLIILLTSTYVPSNLLSILEHQQTDYRVVYPIFYKLSPCDLISNIKNYERFFLYDELKRLQAALKEIAQMPGYTLTDKSESELIHEIVKDVSTVLSSNDKVNMIGMDMQVEQILSLLSIESPDVRSIGIWGTVGIGKTTISEEIFRRISVNFETCVFLKDLDKEVEIKGQNAVREDFFCKLLEVEPDVVRFSDIKTSFLKSRLQCKKVLVILDDVNDFAVVKTFSGKLSYFGPGSRVIITSRNRHVFVLCKMDCVYEVKPLDISKSLLLLDRGTRSHLSREVYRTLSLELVKFSHGNPQVLHFLSDGDWKRLSQQIPKTSPIYIPGVLERSCCGLDDNERSIFLDIACFFRRMDKDNVAMLLDGCGFSAHVGFKGLVDKSLLTISHNLVDMHSFLQATGREIVRQESQKPEYCSRLWNPEVIVDVIIHDKGTSAIEGIFLDMSKLNFDANPYVFDKMCNLRLLKFYCSEVIENRGVSFPQGLEYLPSKLRLLHWEFYPLSS